MFVQIAIEYARNMRANSIAHPRARPIARSESVFKNIMVACDVWTRKEVEKLYSKRCVRLCAGSWPGRGRAAKRFRTLLNATWRLSPCDHAALKRGRALGDAWFATAQVCHLSHRRQCNRAARSASVTGPKGCDMMENPWKRHHRYQRLSWVANSSCSPLYD